MAPFRVASVAAILLLGGVPFAACASRESNEQLGTSSSDLRFADIKPVSTVYVSNAGALDIETEYLPKVVCCENGMAHPQALEAQAVMARSYMYFRMAEDGLGTQSKPFSGTVSDQAFHCATPVSTKCIAAVAATRDQIMTYTRSDGDVIANVSFFIDGPRPSCLSKEACSCPVPSTSTTMSPQDHPSACECFTFSSQGGASSSYLTYNWSHSGEGVTKSSLGSMSHTSNRGCASQNIQNCLAYAGWSYADQLRFFYGQDIELRLTSGSLVGNDAGTTDGGGPVLGDTGVDPSKPSGPSYGQGENPAEDDAGGGCGIARVRSPSTSFGAMGVLALAALIAGRRRR